MRQQYDRSAFFKRQADGWQRSPYPGIGSDPAIADRDIEVFPDQDPLAGQIQVFHA
jgi:hypothetical protein